MTKKKYNDALVLNLDDLFRRRGIEKPIAWMMKQGIPSQTAHKLLHGKFKRGIPLYHLATICQKLYCTPNDLFSFHPLPVDDLPDHPLQALKREPSTGKLKKLMDKLPPDKLTEVEKFIEGMNK